MKTHKKAGRRLFLAALIGFLLSACSVWLIPLVMNKEDGTISFFNIIIGIIFWIGILVGIAFFVITWMKVKEDVGYREVKETLKPGYVRFFANRYATIADCLMIISWLVTIIGSFFIRIPAEVLVPVLFFALYSLYLHFMLNGRVYSYISKKNQKKKERENEKQD